MPTNINIWDKNVPYMIQGLKFWWCRQCIFDFSYNLRAEPDNFWLQVVATMADYYKLPLDTYELTVPLMDNNFLLTGGKQRLMPQQ